MNFRNETLRFSLYGFNLPQHWLEYTLSSPYGHLKILTIANSSLQDAIDTWTPKKKKTTKPIVVNMMNQPRNKRNSSNVLPSGALYKKSCGLLWVFFLSQAARIAFVWMTSSFSCFCRAAKAILGWWETCRQHIWNTSLVDKELYDSPSKFSGVRKGWSRFDFRRTEGVRSCLAFWLCFSRRICMYDCLGRNHTQQNLKRVTAGDALPLTISPIVGSVNRVKQLLLSWVPLCICVYLIGPKWYYAKFPLPSWGIQIQHFQRCSVLESEESVTIVMEWKWFSLFRGFNIQQTLQFSRSKIY